MNQQKLNYSRIKAAGKIDPGFVNYVKSKDEESSKFRWGSVFFYDPITKSGIDFAHFAASLNALRYNTSDYWIITDALGEDNMVNALASWAGDLQKFMRNDVPFISHMRPQVVYSYTCKHLFLKQQYYKQYHNHFPLSDLLADVDSSNINYFFDYYKNKSYPHDSLSVIMNDYYNNKGYVKTRYKRFLFLTCPDNQKVFRSNFRSIVGNYTNKNVTLQIPWPLFADEKGQAFNITEEQSVAFRNAFVDKIYELALAEGKLINLDNNKTISFIID